MRKRIEPIATIEPKPCEHPVLTYEGASAPACLWGSTRELATPSHLADEASDALYEHLGPFSFEHKDYPVRPEVLGPDGQPFTYQRARWDIPNPRWTSRR